MQRLGFLFAWVLLLAGSQSFAFPEMIRMGYVNCSACHVSPTGGGMLSDYGRSISNEVLSTWSYAHEELPGHGFAPEPPAWLKIGGDVRSIQIYVDTPRDTSTSFFPMQADLELAFSAGRFTYVQDLGAQGGPDGSAHKGEFVAHRMYALYNSSEETYVRGGKYTLPYGLGIPDHTSYIRRNLGLDQGQETYNMDAGWIGESWNLIVGGSFGRSDSWKTDLEKGPMVQVAANIGDTHKISFSAADLRASGSHRILAGPAVLWGFSPRWIFLGEYDYQIKTVDGSSGSVTQKGVVTYSRLQYEWYKGLHTYLQHQLSYLNFDSLKTRVNDTGLGVLFYPRPHFEVGLQLSQTLLAEVNEKDTVGWVLAHYYF